jgi:acyl-CoA thioester hydrolase
MSIDLFPYSVTVKQEDTDSLQHTNNVAYVHWMQEAAIAHSTANGWPTRHYLEKGHAWVARRHTIDYLRQTRRGDGLLVLTWVVEMRKVRSTRRYRFIRLADEMIVANAETQWGFVEIATGRPTRIPKEVSDCFHGLGKEPSYNLSSLLSNYQNLQRPVE